MTEPLASSPQTEELVSGVTAPTLPPLLVARLCELTPAMGRFVGDPLNNRGQSYMLREDGRGRKAAARAVR